MLSAVVDAEITSSALSLGADDYLTKPSSIDYLRARIKAAQSSRERVRAGKPRKEVSLEDITKDLLEQQVALFERLTGPSSGEES